MRRRGRGRRYYDEWDVYDRRPTIAAKGGIKAQSRRGEFGSSWWARRWIAVLEGFSIGGRLQRGRSYARRGQVLNVDIEAGHVTASVQGSRSTPYRVTVKVKPLAADDWQKLAIRLASQAIFAAKLLAGEMPEDIEKAFTSAGLSLFPERLRDLETTCSCPDWSNPCKHVAAVYYLLGEEFDRDPFLIFKLRGMSREHLLHSIGAAGQSDPETGQSLQDAALPRSEPAKGSRRGKRSAKAEASDAVIRPPEPLGADAVSFWNGVEIGDDFFGTVNPPPVTAPLPRRLGGFPFWRGARPLFDAIEKTYSQASLRGMEVFIGESAKKDS